MKIKHTLLALLLLQTLPGYTYFLLEDVMSKDVQRRTGVIGLNSKQKRALETWLNEKFELKTPQREEQNTGLFLSINIDGGKKLQLSDGTFWEIAPSDVATSSIWITPFPVRISNSTDPNYPFVLTNTISGVAVRARQASATPAVQPEQPPSPEQNLPQELPASETPPAEQTTP
ncbi:MAG: hypothetical protein HYZ48_03970 [Chlamydiales bacterium]|nr:hypothetical protein [Chlamydiales bacterium]